MPLPAIKEGFELTPEQLEELQSEDDYLRGTAALEILNQAVVKTGVRIPASHAFKQSSPELARTAVMGVFPLIGGMPAMALWASENRTEYYRLFAKMAPAETNVTGGGNTLVMTNMPESALDDIMLKPKKGNKVVEAETREG
jgi:hypothetical protein